MYVTTNPKVGAVCHKYWLPCKNKSKIVYNCNLVHYFTKIWRNNICTIIKCIDGRDYSWKHNSVKFKYKNFERSPVFPYLKKLI